MKNIIAFWPRRGKACGVNLSALYGFSSRHLLGDALNVAALERAKESLVTQMTSRAAQTRHGAGWAFVLWGFFHGIWLGLNHLWQELWGWAVLTLVLMAVAGLSLSRSGEFLYHNF